MGMRVCPSLGQHFDILSGVRSKYHYYTILASPRLPPILFTFQFESLIDKKLSKYRQMCVYFTAEIKLFFQHQHFRKGSF